MIFEIIGVLMIVLVIAVIINIIEENKRRRNSKISFRESMELVELPVVTFYNGSKKLNFLLDTGSNKSIINKAILSELNHEMLDEKESTFGMEGNNVETEICSMTVYYRKNKFNEVFSVIDMSAAFDMVKQESGVQIHGILGSKFFEKYKYVLDYNDLSAYMK